MPTQSFLVAVSVMAVACAVATEGEIDFGKYFKYEDREKLLRKLESDYPGLAKLHSIGQSVQGKEIYVLQVSSGVGTGNRLLGKPMFKFVANMHGNEAVGNALVVFLAQYLLLNYGKEDRVTKLVNGTDLWLMPSLNPDGFEAGQEGKCYQVKKTNCTYIH
jgi:carboxypeptidase D